VLHVSGWTIAVFSTFVINHFDLFGLQQVWFNFRDKPEPAPNYTERLFYKIVRHPLQMGFLMGFWITPTMSWTLFTLSTFMTIYIFIGLHYEEKDLVVSLGDSYTDYQKRVRKLIPIPK
jgi:protein-S-isoprenylcysteine O-methyltransferase Ste14